jgi:hypothetical protein
MRSLVFPKQISSTTTSDISQEPLGPRRGLYNSQLGAGTEVRLIIPRHIAFLPPNFVSIAAGAISNHVSAFPTGWPERILHRTGAVGPQSDVGASQGRVTICRVEQDRHPPSPNFGISSTPQKPKARKPSPINGITPEAGLAHCMHSWVLTEGSNHYQRKTRCPKPLL